MNNVKHEVEYKSNYTGKWMKFLFDSEKLEEARKLKAELIEATANRYEYRIVKVITRREVVE